MLYLYKQTERLSNVGEDIMKVLKNLPNEYKEIYGVNLQKNKKLAFLLNFAAFIVIIVMMVAMHFVVPISSSFNMHNGKRLYILKCIVFIIASIFYLVLHELVHGVAMRICGTKKVKYGFNGLYAFAGSNDFYDRKSYIFIALAPVVLFGVVIAIINFIVSIHWFWIVYFLQIENLSGAVGDIFVTAKFLEMTAFSKQKEQANE